MKNKTLSIFFIFFIFVASATVASAGTETQLTQGERLTLRTSIYGNNVFWTEITGNDVHAYDLTTGKRTDILGHYATGQINACGNKVVWTGDDGDAVYMYDISTGNETNIASERRNPDIYGNYVVYTNNYYYGEDHQNDGIYLYDLNAQNETKIATVYSSPAIYGKKVVWSQENSTNGYDIYLYEISTQQTSTITTTNSSISESELDIYGNVVVWTESGNVYVYDIASHKKTQVTSSGNAYQPAIYGNWIVYTIGDPYSGGSKDIYMYEISTARTTRITTSTLAFGPSVYGDKIVYADSRNDPETEEVRDVYLYDLSNTSNNIITNFTSNVTSGTAPLEVSFTNTSTGTSNAWYWDFGDGDISSEQDPAHTYLSAGNYTVCLTVSNANGIDSKLATINVSGKTVSVLPVANFSSNITSGYAPLTVQFTDLSKNAAGWNWDFGDGTNSTLQNPVHTYELPGNYIVNLILSNENVTASKTATITVTKKSSNGGSSHSSSGGGAGGSPEPAKNIEVKELSQTFVTSGNSAKFDFLKNATSVIYVSFDSKKTAGKTTTTVEMLKNKSTLTSDTPTGEIYKYLNIWIGSSGFGTSRNFENAVVCFKVKKSWIKDKSIDQSSITLNVYSDKKWDQLSTNLSGEDDKYLYFTAKTPVFSSFAITGKTNAAVTEVQITTGTETQTKSNTESTAVNTGQTPEQKENPSMPAFEVTYGIAGLLAVFLYRRK